MAVKVTQISGTYNYEIGNVVDISGREVIIKLDTPPINNAYLRIDILENKIEDLSGNQSAPMSPQIGLVARY